MKAVWSTRKEKRIPDEGHPPRESYHQTIQMAVPVHIVVASDDSRLMSLASDAAGGRWHVESCSKLASAEEFLTRPELKLVLFDDQILGCPDSSSALVQLRKWAPHAAMIYIAAAHSSETEKLARAAGVHYYTSKPIEAERFSQVVRSFLNLGTREVSPIQRPSPGRSLATMKAFVMKELNRVGFVDKPIAQPGINDAIVKTTRALICTSDSHTVHGAIGARENLTLGHEAVGVVHQIGAEVRLFKPGDRVVVGAITPSWSDLASQAGHSSQSGGPLGGWKFANSKDGVFAEYFHVNDADANMAHIPDSITDESAVYCCDMISTGFMAAENADIPIGGTVAVFALGPVGLMAVVGARLRGAGMIIGIDSVPKRKELARQYGADAIVDHSGRDPVQQVRELTAGVGVDSAIEALGSSDTFQSAVKVTKPGGTISNAGYHGIGEFVSIPRLDWGVGMAEKTIRSGLCPGGRLRMERLLRILEGGRIDPTRMTTHTFHFDELEKAFQIMDRKLDGVIKPLIVF